MSVPGIHKWKKYAGGTSAAPGKFSYKYDTEHGTYSIAPVSSPEGRHRGYRVLFLRNKSSGAKLPHSGLFHAVGGDLARPAIYRSPHKAASAAREHHRRISPTPKKESGMNFRPVNMVELEESKVCTHLVIDRAKNGFVVNVSYEDRPTPSDYPKCSSERLVFPTESSLINFVKKQMVLPKEEADRILSTVLEGEKYEGSPGQEGDWRYRRRRRINRYASLFRHIISPGFDPSASPEAAARAHRTLKKIAKSAEKWTSRGAARGAGGRIRHDPDYLVKLIRKYKKESADHEYDEGWNRKQRLLAVMKVLNRSGSLYRQHMTARGKGSQGDRGGVSWEGPGRAAKLKALKAAAILARQVPKLKGKGKGKYMTKRKEAEFATRYAKLKKQRKIEGVAS